MPALRPRPPPSVPLGGRHGASITGPEDTAGLGGRTLNEAVGVGCWESGQLGAGPGLGVETRDEA